MTQDNPNQPTPPIPSPSEPLDLEALIAVVEQRIVDNLARLIEQMAERKRP